MRRDKFTARIIPSTASASNPVRIECTDEAKILSVAVINVASSVGNLIVGLDSDEGVIPLEPGDSQPFAGRDNSYLYGTYVIYWDAAATTKNGRVIIGKDAGEAKVC